MISFKLKRKDPGLKDTLALKVQQFFHLVKLAEKYALKRLAVDSQEPFYSLANFFVRNCKKIEAFLQNRSFQNSMMGAK